MTFRVDATDRAGRLVLAVSGEFDVAAAPVFRSLVEEKLTASPQRLVVDLTETVFADSTAFGLLARAASATTSAGGTMQIVCPVSNRQVRKVLDLLGMDALVPVRETLREDS